MNSAAWIEFDSPDLDPADALLLQLSISEYNMCDFLWCFKKVFGALLLTFVNMYEITNLGAKVGQPVAYPSKDGATAYRLEIPHPDGSGGMMRALIGHHVERVKCYLRCHHRIRVCYFPLPPTTFKVCSKAYGSHGST